MGFDIMKILRILILLHQSILLINHPGLSLMYSQPSLPPNKTKGENVCDLWKSPAVSGSI